MDSNVQEDILQTLVYLIHETLNEMLTRRKGYLSYWLTSDAGKKSAKRMVDFLFEKGIEDGILYSTTIPRGEVREMLKNGDIPSDLRVELNDKTPLISGRYVIKKEITGEEIWGSSITIETITNILDDLRVGVKVNIQNGVVIFNVNKTSLYPPNYQPSVS